MEKQLELAKMAQQKVEGQTEAGAVGEIDANAIDEEHKIGEEEDMINKVNEDGTLEGQDEIKIEKPSLCYAILKGQNREIFCFVFFFMI